MNLKRFSAAALALAMAASLPAALADGPENWTAADGARAPMVIAPNPNAAPEAVDVPQAESYKSQLFLNDEVLDASAIPGVAPGLLPMRLICEADGGMAEWYEEDNQAFFYLANQRIVVSFADNSVKLNFEPVEAVTATLVDGVTFLPASFVNSLEGVEVNENPEMNVDRIDIKTLNGTPLMKLANELLDTAGMGRGMQSSPAELEEVYGEALGFKAEYMTEGVVFLPMMVSPDTLVVGKAAEGKLDALKECFEAYRKTQEDTFSWYLSQNLPKVQDARFVTEGDWFMFLIAENADQAVELFHTRAAEMK